jgi:membrane fusion protein (multidrug efflux system)
MMTYRQILAVLVRWRAFPARQVTIACLAASVVCITTVSFAQQAAGPAPAVVIEKVEVKPVDASMHFTARVEAIRSVDLRARVAGFLQSVAFKDGQEVKAGDTLFEIEPDQLNASVASAHAQVARAEATRKSAERTLSRNRSLLARNTVSQAIVDDSQAAFDISVADVEVAQAALSTAKLNLSYARITAPISGSIGRAAFTAGNLVGPDSGPLARIVSLDPVRVAFSVTEGELITVRQKQASGKNIDPDTLSLSLRLANDSEYEEPGRLEFVEHEVDPQTGTVTARAIFPNPHHILIPGQFVKLGVREKDTPDMPIIPQTAVLQDREGRFVFLLAKDNTVSQRRIATGPRVGSGWAVTSGLTGGEQVVVQGTQRLTDGMTVAPSEGQPVGNGS